MLRYILGPLAIVSTDCHAYTSGLSTGISVNHEISPCFLSCPVILVAGVESLSNESWREYYGAWHNMVYPTLTAADSVPGS